jgi:hypothetical protein
MVRGSCSASAPRTQSTSRGDEKDACDPSFEPRALGTVSAAAATPSESFTSGLGPPSGEQMRLGRRLPSAVAEGPGLTPCPSGRRTPRGRARTLCAARTSASAEPDWIRRSAPLHNIETAGARASSLPSAGHPGREPLSFVRPATSAGNKSAVLQAIHRRRLGHGIGPRCVRSRLNGQRKVPICRYFKRRERRDSNPRPPA